MQTYKKFRVNFGTWKDVGKVRKAIRPADTCRPYYCGATENRTRDTRIFSPLLYQLSYGTRSICLANAGAKIRTFSFPASFWAKKVLKFEN